MLLWLRPKRRPWCSSKAKKIKKKRYAGTESGWRFLFFERGIFSVGSWFWGGGGVWMAGWMFTRVILHFVPRGTIGISNLGLW
jgi:hypothetical protein